jgi:WD40 repeat protein
MTATATPEPPPRRDAQPERPDVFISYSRHDQSFVRGLAVALEERGKDVWIDWEDIRKTADWRARIEDGIESARAIVAVLSPEFAASEVCAAEIAHAVAQNKRIVPVVRREPDKTRLRNELNAPNWIFLRERDDFGAGVDEIVEAVDTDLAWLDQHARLLVRAMEWDRHTRNSSFLLRGSDLEAAEGWLASQAAHKENATALQGEYIVASRRAAAKRQRITLGSIALALAVAIGLAGLAALLWRQAVERERVARSRELAVSAASELSSDPELSVLLAAKAVETSKTSEAEQVLRRSLIESHAASTLCGHRGFVHSTAFSHDGKLVATAGGDGTARLWEVPTGRMRFTLRGHEALVSRVAFSPDNRLLATVSDDGTARLWDVRTGRNVSVFHGHTGPVVDAAVSPDERVMVTASTDGVPRLWTTGGRSRDVYGGRELSGHDGSVMSVGISPKGKVIASASDDKTARLWTTAGKPLRVLRGHTEGLTAVVFSSAGTLVATTSFDGTARLWEVPSGRLVRVLRGHDWGILGGGFSANGDRFVTASMDSTARIWDVESGRTISVLRGHTTSLTHASFSPDATLVLTASNDGTARLWRSATGEAVAEFRGHHGSITDASFAPTGRYAVSSSYDGTARLWKTDTMELVASYGTESFGDSVSFSADGKRLLTVSGGRAQLWNVSPRKLVRDFSFPSRYGVTYLVSDAALSPDQKSVVIAGEDDSRLLDAETGRVRRIFRGHTSLVYSVAFSRDGNRIATASLDNTARAWDPASGRSLKVFRAGGTVYTADFNSDASRVVTAGSVGKGKNQRYRVAVWEVSTGRRVSTLDRELPVSSAVFSPNGELVLETGGRDTATISDPETGAAVTVFRGHTQSVLSAAFSPDGKLAVTAAEDGTAQMWETETGRRVHVFREGDPSRSGVVDVKSAAFSPDGTLIAVAGDDVTARVYRCAGCAPLESLLATARGISRTLTDEEQLKFFHGVTAPAQSGHCAADER